MQPGQWPLALLMALMTVRTVTLLFSYGAGTPGGLFMPLLALGAVAGLVFAALLQHMGLTPATCRVFSWLPEWRRCWWRACARR